ncbi:MAG TPA: universal stress protein [Longimicrobiaceae bacterium]
MAVPVRTIVVGVASTCETDPALPAAAEIARRHGAALHAVHVFEVPECLAASSGGYPDLHAAGLSDRLRAQAARFADGVWLTVHVLAGSPHERLTELAARLRADLLVVGATRRGRLRPGAVGATAERVLASSPVPVLVLHAPFFHEVRRVLVATDLSPLAGDLFERGLDAAEALFGSGGLEARALFMVDPELLPGAAELGRAALDRFLAERRPRPFGVAAEVRTGEPAAGIAREAEAWGPDLLVMGTRGRVPARGGQLGSVAAAALRRTRCNALVVPAPGRRARPRPGAARSERAAAGTS